ncbi:MAG: BA14K family protein, partial [Alphaproteobacteria bacterium]|nr:BA14K family protein [Alphaproteobacteria bacterium]
HGRGFGPAVGAGLAFGALATAPYWGGYGYDCGAGVVTYDAFGNAVVTDGCY